ncbi:amino acid ABC transporter permease [Breoghania sp.]|uniref:amino acid ABC transporter permease n=1 Tax=Breoghania sp. TaxID=2065378 RepID=UPI002610CE10|nr:amino acid ABC transporter permease [Breoghania sp.]MDJ0930591.1 amino acid ABC transporter permease [Breoghania sp.]
MERTPYEEHYRGAIVVALVTLLAIYTAIPRFWNVYLIPIWAVCGVISAILMFGSVFWLPFVGTDEWGGLPLTMIVFLTTVGFGFPLAILFALGRRSKLPIIKAVCVITIEIVRGLSLISVLFMMIIFLSLFLPGDLTIDKLLRALVGMVIFFGAYSAEVIRGGLQAVPNGQYDAVKALGLNYLKSHILIILLQALRTVLPALVNDIIGAFKNTTFASIIGIFDIFGAAKASLRDVSWTRYATEVYIFVALIFFIYCFSMAKYSAFIERRSSKERAR